MSGVKRTRTDEITTSSSQPPTTTVSISPKIETPSAFNSSVEEDYNW